MPTDIDFGFGNKVLVNMFSKLSVRHVFHEKQMLLLI